MLNAVAQRLRNFRHHIVPERAPNRIPAQRQGKLRLLAPPLTKIDNFVQSALSVGKLSFVDDQPSLKISCDHFRNDLVEGTTTVSISGANSFKRKIRRRQRSRYGDLYLVDCVQREFLAGHNHRPIAFAY